MACGQRLRNTQLASECSGRTAERAGRMAEARIRELEAEVERYRQASEDVAARLVHRLYARLWKEGDSAIAYGSDPSQTLRR